LINNVFILGAGASKQAGAPLMYDFIDKAEELYRSYPRDTDLKLIFDTIAELQSVYAKSNLDLDNIEVLFGVIEMANLIEKLVNHSKEQIQQIRDALINVIVRTLESNINYPVLNNYIQPPEPYDKFTDILLKLKSNNSIITFNYDTCMDYALMTHRREVDYCLDIKKSNGGFKLLKLHGSVNWGRCPNEGCGKILPLELKRVIDPRLLFGDEADESLKFEISKRLAEKLVHKECGNMTVSKVPVIVPPTWNKTGYHGDLANVWNAAALELSNAVNIFVVGYSLPETDSFFRYLYALGTLSTTKINRFWVFNPDNSGKIEDRFRNLIGKGIEKRFQYFATNFSGAIDKFYEIQNDIGQE
jgi:hypothetical protein